MKKLLLILILCIMLVLPASAVGEKYLALTFDDGPSGRFTRRLLEELEKADARATFFLCGYRMEAYPELTKRILAEGHEIGLHGYSHNCMGTMDEAALARELDDTQALLEQLTGQRSFLLRPPGGSFGKSVADAAAKRGLTIITWSVDPRDWATDDAGLIISRVVSQAKDGDIILLHDMSDSSVEAAAEILRLLQAKGFTFVTVSGLFALREAKMVPGKVCGRLPAE